MALSQKSAIGLDRLYYAIQTSDVSTGVPVYGTIYQLVGAKALSFNAAASLITTFADDSAFETFESMGEKGITLSIVDLLPEDKARLLGYNYAGGIMEGNDSDSSPYVAIMGRAMLSDGSYRYVRYHKVKFGKPNAEDATREATPAPRTVTLEGRVASLISSTYAGKFMEEARSDDTNAATAISTWFTAIGYQSAATGALTVAAAAGAAGEVVFTFTKAGGNTILNQGTFINPNISIFLNSTGAVQSPTWTFGTSGGATQTATAAGCTAGASTWVVTDGIKDFNGIGATPKGGTVTIS
jgi:phi13 family phage major tail protein